MKKIFPFLLLILVMFFLAGCTKSMPRQSETTPAASNIPVQEGAVEENIDYQSENFSDQEKASVDQEPLEDPQATVASFMEYFLLSAPPDPDQEAVDQAINLFSEGGKSRLPNEDGQYSIARILGVQDIPDLGYEINDPVYQLNPATQDPKGMATINVTLNYSGGDTQRIFNLSQTPQGWKIDIISTN
jgi:hypothetical protein